MNNAGKVAFLPRGEYDDYNEYEILDFVSNENGAYVSRKIKQIEVAPTDEEVSENWQPLLLKPNPDMIKRKIDMKSVVLDADGHICVNPLYIPWGDGTVKEKEYNITYTMNGGFNQRGIYPTTYLNTSTCGINNTWKDGYVFTGWTGNIFTNPTVNALIPKHTNGDMALTANFREGQTYGINYVMNDGTLPSGAKTSYTEGSYYNPPIPSRDGYIFTGWTPNGIKRSDSGDKTLTANWIAKNATNPIVVFYPCSLYSLWSQDNNNPPTEDTYMKYGNNTYSGDKFYITPRDLFMDCRGTTNSGYHDYNRAMAEPHRITVSKNNAIEIYNNRQQRNNIRTYGSAVLYDGTTNISLDAGKPFKFKTSGSIAIHSEWGYYSNDLYIYGLDDDVTITPTD